MNDNHNEVKIPDECRWIVVVNGVAATTIFAFTGSLKTDAQFIQGVVSPAVFVLVLGVSFGLVGSVVLSKRKLLCNLGIAAFVLGCGLGLATLFSKTCATRDVQFARFGGLTCIDR